MAEAATGLELGHVAALLAAGVVAVPIFRKLGLGSVLGYLAAGVAIGPFGLALFREPQTILHVAEFGVVIFLFIIGLEMRPKRLWGMRKEIFGLGSAQVGLAGLALTLVAMAAGVSAPVAFVGAMGFVMSSTAVIVQMLEERGDLPTPSGQRAVSILLFEDLAIVPLLAIVALLGASMGQSAESTTPLWQSIGLALAALAGVLAVGVYAINPVFRFLARNGGREVMTAAALLVVAGTAWIMDGVGLSMAMGAFLAGVLLSDSTFRHQLEADVEPFRAILLGLFFLSVGMALDIGVVVNDWRIVVAGLAAFMVVKALVIYVVARVFKARHHEAIERAALFAQGGEFAFVLYSAAATAGVIDAQAGAALTAIVILSMALTPLTTLALKRLLPKEAGLSPEDAEGVDAADGLGGQVLIIGFGRFAQVVSQPLLARDVDVSIIENDVEMIQAAGNFGFKVYYGDGTRLDTLRASGAGKAEAVLVCVDKPEAADKIVQLVKSEFPGVKLMVRAFDRGHSLRLIQAGVDYQVRETFESALRFGQAVLEELGLPEDEVADVIADVRRRDEARLDLDLTGGLKAGAALMRGNMPTPQPTPYIKPHREGRLVNEDEAPPEAVIEPAAQKAD
ncbi:monovalent cation:proton antiporter-2 (CPA2) family protein [Brevundimonas sp. 3P9-tot-E]|uniref:monovalent cation:proton antiporter-2 (CPA2) family protein n=1 Tax=Brevundimonas TaxID=41275 RepID=UPI00190847D4|nr:MULTISPECIES: monovalent cation:proton antiporter-2 (CPA2) family protein [Brevundimonas]MDA0744570.1 monovalent cation:proton antiporter-2 (CPA2) family protein [Pseudomonadota bacterium]MBK1969152.1 cation:proton antiporter [Brevundimonas diminuta]MBK1974457.1 cation:proton antiporter [Brevundimonas diminuta]MDA1321842.1 monovalent cation:proton antiporter-2 (CPA2) family protein [Pseudomonadota bacterium]MDM8353224.1 monovalent cation:proton antiporter-2 (CPA2) family protein [Brevundimo